MKKTLISSLIGLTLASGFAATPALAASASSEFQTGMQAFRGGDYARACTAFEAARREGMRSPALSYNLGVCHYRLGEYSAAAINFKAAAQHPPLTAIATYNLGLVALKQGRSSQADSYFREVVRDSDDAKLRALAEAQLQRKPASASGAGTWLGSIGLSYGHDDNVLDPTQAPSTRSDNFTELFAAVSGRLAGTVNNGLYANASLYALDYAKVNAYDLNVIRGGLAQRLTAGEWRLEGGLSLAQSHLNGKEYLRETELSLQGQRHLGSQTRMRLRYRYTNVSALKSQYNYLEGYRQQADVLVRHNLGKSQLFAGYALELNDRKDLRTATTFTSYSPTRNTVRLGTVVALSENWQGRGEVRYRNSSYADAYLLRSGQRTKRNDDETRVALRLSRRLGADWRLNADYQHTNNSSNIKAYDYTRNLVMVGVNWLF